MALIVWEIPDPMAEILTDAISEALVNDYLICVVKVYIWMAKNYIFYTTSDSVDSYSILYAVSS